MSRRVLLLLACLLPPALGLAAWAFAAWRLEVNESAGQQPTVVVQAAEDPAVLPVVGLSPVAEPAPPLDPQPAPTTDSSDDDYADQGEPPVPADLVQADEEGGAGIIHAYPDELSQQYAGANGAHRMKEALAVISVDCLAGHRFGSIHMKKVYRKDTDLMAWAQSHPQQAGDVIGNYWFVTDKIGPNEPNFGIFETGPTNAEFAYALDGCTRVGPQMYAQYQGMLDAINATKRWIALFLGLPPPTDYTITDFFNFVMSAQGYDLDSQKVAEGRYWQSPGYTQTGNNLITGTVTIRGKAIPVKLYLEVHQFTARVDYNNDRRVTADDDAVKDVAPMEFWVNGNKGYAEDVRDDGTNDIPSGDADSVDDHANGVRDLIDFAPVSFVMDKGLMDMLNNRRDRFVVRARYTSGDGRVTLFPVSRAITNGGDYGADGSGITAESVARYGVTVARGLGFQNALFSGIAQPSTFNYSTETWLLLEGSTKGSVKLTIEILDIKNDEIMEADTILMNIKDVADMYSHYMASTQETSIEANLGLETTRTRYESINYQAGKRISDLTAGAPVIVFLHGFNVNLDASTKWFDEVFKRLYWSKYKGEFMGITWNGAIGGNMAPVLFNTNIESSFKTGPTVSYFLDGIGSDHPITMMAHSAGNIAMLEALRIDTVRGISPRVRSMITMEAATFTSVYDDLVDVPFKNISHNNLFKASLSATSGQRWNFYSATDFTLSDILVANETVPPPIGFKAPGYITTAQQRLEMEAIPRTNSRAALVIPGTRSPGPSLPDYSRADIVPNLTRPLGNVQVPQVQSLNCEPEGYGLRNPWRNVVSGSHSFMRETNYYETRLLYRKIKEIAQ